MKTLHSTMQLPRTLWDKEIITEEPSKGRFRSGVRIVKFGGLTRRVFSEARM